MKRNFFKMKNPAMRQNFKFSYRTSTGDEEKTNARPHIQLFFTSQINNY